MTSNVSDEDSGRIMGAVFAGQHIEAIKIYRAATGCELKEALEFVNRLEERLRAESPEKFTASPRRGCGTAVVVLVLLVLLAAGGVVAFIGAVPPAAALVNRQKPQAPPARTVQKTINVSNPATPLDMQDELGPPFPTDLTGKWRMHMPAGFEHPVEVTRIDDDHYGLRTVGVMNGTYKLSGNRLVMERPADHQQQKLWKFRWKINDGDSLVLIGQPDWRSYGANYLGTTINRVTP